MDLFSGFYNHVYFTPPNWQSAMLRTLRWWVGDPQCAASVLNFFYLSHKGKALT